jgi:hypothetical protein
MQYSATINEASTALEISYFSRLAQLETVAELEL